MKQSQRKINGLDLIFGLGDYQGNLKKILHDIKFNQQKILAKFMSNLIKKEIEELKDKFDMAIPVPINKKRKKIRGFDHLEIIFKNVFDEINLEVNNKIVIRQKNTLFLHQLNAKERKKELENAFSVSDNNKKLISNKKILLVDDILTTGESVKSLLSEITQSNPKSVSFLTLSEVR